MAQPAAAIAGPGHRFPSIAAYDASARARRTAAADLDGTLLASSSAFPYYFLVALEAGSYLRALVLLLAAPLLLLLYVAVSEDAAIRLLVFIAFAGLRVAAVEAVARGVLPRHYAAGVRADTWRVFRSCGDRRVVVTASPAVMVGEFVREFLGAEVAGTELETFASGRRFTGRVKDVLVGRKKREVVERLFAGGDMPDVGLGDRESDHDFMALCKISNIIFVDQPTGTGFSYSSDSRDTRHDETGVSSDLYDFLQVFFNKHPEYVKNDFYITGESYAGHYIPAFASRIHQGNKAKEGIHINLKGFAIGNGLTNPEIQYKAYTDYALDMNLIEQSDSERINKYLPPCEFAIKLCGSNGKASCMAAYMVCNSIFNSIMRLIGTKNYYDVRKECEGKLCYDFSNLDKFFDDKAVRESIGVGDMQFVSCSPVVYQAMITDWMRNLEVGIPALLEDGIHLLVYAGEYDLICNWLGNSRWVHSMEWSGQKDFVSSHETSFVVDGAEAGVLKSHGPLTFLKVHNAGHMVPMDQPKASLEMLRRFTQGKLAESPPTSHRLNAVV